MPHCSTPGRDTIIIIDNRSIRHEEGYIISQKLDCNTNSNLKEVHVMIEQKSCELEILPSYSLDFNPIKNSFHIINTTLKGSHQLHGKGNFDDLVVKLRNTVNTRITL